MLDQDHVQELTESYLKNLFTGVIPSLSEDFDLQTPFGELGVDSFRVLKIIKELEGEFGTLPKTLLFENFNIEALAHYFVDHHSVRLKEKFSKGANAPAVPSIPASAGDTENLQKAQKPCKSSPKAGIAVTPPPLEPALPVASLGREGIRILEDDLPRHPGLHRVVRELFESHKSEGCVSRGTRNIAPNLFIGSAKRGYFNYCRSGNIILVYAYTGPKEYFDEVAQEIHEYCAEREYQLNIFADAAIASIGNTQLSATPFGVLQRVLNIQDFSLNGSKMRRLRYQVSKFEKSGECRTEEYRCGTDRDTDRNIAEIIDHWCETKPMVNPLVQIVKEEILAGSLDAQHRIFLTYLDGVLQNTILITEMCAELNGYLMDLEFYPKGMPLGGLEYAIVQIMETLAAEGRDMLSLGGTYGCRIETSPSADPEIERVLDDLHKQGIFNDDGNLQFKNKFRPENRSVYLCRPLGSGRADNIIDIVMMIADPDRMQTPETENHNVGDKYGQLKAHKQAAVETTPLIEGELRLRELAESGFNPLNILQEQVDFDLKSDSWAQLDAPYVAQHMGYLRSQLQQSVSVDDSLKGIFPFDYFILSDAGRSAERVFYKAWPKKGIVLQNLLFPTGIYHQIDNAFTPRELPHPMLIGSDSAELYKADIHWDDLQAEVVRNGPNIAFVCIEVSNNATGGLPVSGPHLRLVKEFLAGHSIPLVLDGTRIIENARFLIEQDRNYAGKTTWEVVREILSCADVVIASLPKDFCIDRGGVIATNDETLLRRLQAVVRTEGGGLDVIEKKLIGLALRNRGQIETRVGRRMEAVGTLWSALKAADIPVTEPAGGHCVLIDVKQLPQFANFQHPEASFLAWLYLKTGIRAGAHSVGMQKNTAINGLVRLAVPVGLTEEDAVEVARRLVGLFRDGRDIPELGLPGAAGGDIYARYELIRYHRPTRAVTATTIPAEVDSHQKMPPVQPQPLQPKPGPHSTPEPHAQIAIIGMAGRYPQARNMQEFWENLCEGRDSVAELPDDRMALRMQNPFTRNYRGGFIDGIDKFDSLFFNISPREAEVLDPQERLFLEVAWEALEDAGYYPEILVPGGAPRNVGVFVGAVWAMYQMSGVEEKLGGNDANPNSFLWSIANRVSYWMNFTGPSLTLDTACSSSLTAIHLACEAIRNGDCSSAIVGGVNLDLHQSKFDINNSGGALSRDGVCRSFGAGANGYVAGEGVGAVLIKPLERALEDNDQIYAVIKSAVVNHGGRTSGYTVPNPKAQGELIVSALEKAGVDARTIGYIEAHGTGTELGDPVEISGLSRAFAKYEVEKQTCSIGSVKSNIGHLEAAAGVVGLCKVLLQMKHRQLVPSLHSARLNEHIDFDNSPFRVQQQLEPWQNKVLDSTALPLRAGISSFGAGGANAHVIVEGYELPLCEEHFPEGDHIFPMSARSEGQLREMAERLQRHLERWPDAQRLCDVAFTLQNGRKSFDHRLAVVARDRRELIRKLNVFLNGGKDDGLLSGNVKNSEGITKLLSRVEKEQFVGLLSQSRDPRKLAQLWIDGLLSDCRGFTATGRRVSLPTYPFADKRHWIALVQGGTQGIIANAGNGLHPLIDNNASTFQRQIFRKTFQEQEFFLRDHVVSGIPTLPGTAYLDLARKAGEIAAGRNVHLIRNITWISPLAIEKGLPVEAQIELKPNGDSVTFEVFSEDDDGERRLYSQGKLAYASEHVVDPGSEYVDIEAVKSRCNIKLSGADAYRLFDSVGMHYGPSFQLLQEVYKNDDEALGLLKLPAVRDADFDQFLLHPCLLDASMQAGVAGQLGDPTGEMKVPYSLGEVEILHPLTRTCYSYVTKAPGDRSSGGSGLSRENVTIVDESGKVLAYIRECVGVPLTSVHEKSEPAQPAPVRKSGPAGEDGAFAELYYTHVWRPSVLTETQSDAGSHLLFDTDERLRDAYRERDIDVVLVLPGDRFEERDSHTFAIDPQDREGFYRLFETLNDRQWTVGKVCFAWTDASEPDDGEALGQALKSSVYPFLYLCQALIERKSGGDRTQILYLYSGRPNLIQPHNDAINGFLRSLRLENPKIDCKVVEIDQSNTTPDNLLKRVVAELHAVAQGEMTVRYVGGSRYTRTLERLDAAEWGETRTAAPALKHRGVYLITGGAGGLGLLFAGYLAKECSARLVLTGRSQLSSERQARLEELKAVGAEDVLYIAADVSDQEGVRRILQQGKKRFGGIDGIIHSAGVLRDSFLRNKTAEEMAAVFAPKIFGTWYLDEQTREEDLDFFVTFSSLAAVGGNAGQCDYAFANHYMDSFVAAREALRKAGRRSGRALSLNWSLWADGGMKLDEQTEIFFRKNLGIRPLSKEVGLGAFTRGLPAPHAQIAVLEGVRNKIERAWGLVKEEVDSTEPAAARRASVGTDGDKLSSAVIEELSKTVMNMLKVEASDIDLDSILLDLGFDSIGLTSFANRINDKYQVDINPVMFFEYPSIRAVADVLISDYSSAVQAVHGSGQFADTNGSPAIKETAAVQMRHDPGASIAINKHWVGEPEPQPAPGTVSRQNRFIDEPIAIVGMAGVMPQSDNLEEFWENLKNACDLVTEIPRDRWIWEDYDGDPIKEVNRSYSRWGGFMREVDKFDPLFFGITPREAEMMDPQQRILLETVWSAIEDSGHKVSDLSGTRTGVFIGVSAKDYIDVLAENEAALDGYSASGNSHSTLVNRISYLLNLRGPSAPLDTACSSSLIALHRAVESIHTGSSNMAIVGGVQVMLTPIAHISLSSAGMLSREGKCRTFNKDADGYVRGEGSGAIFIKPLAQARADGNPIHAIIKATAENHGGRVTNMTAPNPKAQAELLIEAYEKAQVDPSTVGYIECHGTGTSLGDPIEIQALKKSFSHLWAKQGRPAPETPYCGLSSVKTNIGHLEPAAGIAGLLKALLAVRHKQIPALLHFEELNPYIDLGNSPFYIVDQTRPWQAMVAPDGSELPRRVGVSSFGWGGANAHVVLEECLEPRRRPAGMPPVPLPIVLSAKNEDRLKTYARSLLAHVERHDVELVDLAYTLQVGRDEMTERLGFMAASLDEVKEKLKSFIAGDTPTGAVHHGRVSRKKDDIGLISGNEAIRASVVDKLIAHDDWSKLLELWVKGLDMDWQQLRAGGHLGTGDGRRVSLPTYPFARERYWIDTKAHRKESEKLRAKAGAGDRAVSMAGSAGDFREKSRTQFFREHWQPQAASPLGEKQNGRTIIFADNSLKETLLNDANAGSFDSAVVVYQAEGYQKISERAYHCRFNDQADIRNILSLVSAGSDEPLNIVYAWSRNRGEEGIHALFQLFTAIRESEQPISHVTLVGEYDPLRADTCWDYSWIGFERSLKLYLARTRISLLYCDTGSVTVWQLLDAGRRGGVVWYRGGRRLALSCIPFEPGKDRDPPVVKQGGGYLITGGCGALGLHFAHYLARHYKARLLLTGRSPLSPKIQQQLDGLKEAGALEARYASVDLGDRDGMVVWSKNLPFALCGVIHAAGVESDQTFFEKSSGDIDRVLRPKTTGTRLLDDVLQSQPLDFTCYFSSSSALLGDFGSCDYAIANRFQMAYGLHCQQRSGENGRTIVINWPLWQEGGMGVADPEQTALYLKRTGLSALGTDDGLQIWDQLVSGGQRQTLVMMGQPSRIVALIDKLYPLQQPLQPPSVAGVPPIEQVHKTDEVARDRRRARQPGKLNMHQVERLKQLLKADLLRLQEVGE